MLMQRPLSGPVSVRVAGLALAAIAGVSFYSGLSRSIAVGSHHGPSGRVVVIQPQPQIVAWQRGDTRPVVEPAPVKEARRSPRPAETAAADVAAAPLPPVAATDAAADASAHEPGAAPSAAPAESPVAPAPPDADPPA